MNSQPNLHLDQNLERVEQAIRANPFLKLAILDLTCEDGTLVAAVDHTVSIRFTARLLRSLWVGEVEVYCPMAMMTGGYGERA